MKIIIRDRLGAMRRGLARTFAEKEILFRSQGRMRFLRIGTRLQVAVASAIGMLALAWVAGSGAMLYNHVVIAQDRASVDAKAQIIAAQVRHVDAYRRSVGDVADDLDRRQDMLDDMVRTQFGPVDEDPAVVGAPDAETRSAQPSAPSRKLSAAPGLDSLRAIEQRQTQFARRLVALIDQRAARAEAAIRSFGLNPAQIAARAQSAQGGPYIPLARGTLAPDDVLADLAKALTRLNALERGLVSIPSGRPTTAPLASSSYGYRRDPFNGHAAFHAGVDFPGSYGQPILAAAAGRISYVGRRQGYGNVVEIDHGHGIMTRYAHLSGAAVRAGQDVARGFAVGRMGSTGRSTGTHLHFEVRVNGEPINPLRFLEVKEDVLKVQQIAKQRFARARGKAVKGNERG